MHDTSYEHGRLFFEVYWQAGFQVVVDLGSQDVNGSLRDHCPPEARYVGLDMEPGKGVDLVVEPGAALPFADASVDVAVSTSAFEHDVFFWETFLEMVRVIRPGGLVYINAPSNNDFHRYPLDLWRFYPDAGIGLVKWAAKHDVPVELVESFVAKPGAEGWADFVAVFRKQSDKPLPPTGRIADRTTATNIFSGSAEYLEAEQRQTFEALEIADLRDSFAQAQAQASRAAEEASSLRARVDQLSAATETAEAELREIRASTSWRVTAPVRRVSDLVRRR
ncbi:methyltransferase family protein [Jatrophihabitans sp. GAS493]|uniref:methyltransferase domain-containing protein n=1 Tax=Jatrophihabitans sp. GAS493 TaxID=1907575 RepID=UPI000BB7EB28|nr:methyltransferase domain-containing protein [Jatrophihabitans sp. GAS493]SOD75135.1 methyltransferase family protein [Jatrophihabitans sp. GAS493]